MTTCDRCGQSHAPGAECKGDAARKAAEACWKELSSAHEGDLVIPRLRLNVFEEIHATLARHLRAFVSRADARASRIEAAARALLSKIDAMEKPINTSIMLATIHGMPYTGPQWTDERDALAAALEGKEAGDAEA